MPELPEVEGARRLVDRTCVGKRIAEAIVADDDKVINDIAPRDLEKALAGRTLVAAKRRGKQMWWDFDQGPSLLVHFGMTGGLVVKGIGAAHYKSFHIDDSTWPPRFVKLQLRFEDGTQLAFCDSRRFAKVRFLEDPESRPPISELGWDPVLDMPALEEFAAGLAKQRRAVKALLLDQSFSAGVGNWVADEVLFQARIHPEQPANSIPPAQVAALHAAIRGVCELACEVEADAERFPQDWLFHVRWGKGSGSKSKIVVGGATHTIDHITVGGRTSAIVPALQKLNKAAIAAAAAAAAKASGSGNGSSSGGNKAGGRAKGAAKGRGGGVREEAAVAAAAAGEGSSGEEEAAVKAELSEQAAALAAAEAAVAVAQGPARQRGRRGSKAATVQEAAAVAAGAAAEAAEQQAGGRRGRTAASAAPAAAAGGRGAKRFRGQQAAAAGASGSRDGAGAAASSAGRKRKAAAGTSVQDAAADGGAGGGKAPVSKRRSRK